MSMNGTSSYTTWRLWVCCDRQTQELAHFTFDEFQARRCPCGSPVRALVRLDHNGPYRGWLGGGQKRPSHIAHAGAPFEAMFGPGGSNGYLAEYPTGRPVSLSITADPYEETADV